MRIALVGSHNTGKTSLYGKMYSDPLFSGYEFFPEAVREVNKMGFPINEGATDASQLAMCALHLQHLTYKNIVTDRCLWDNFIYAWVINSQQNSRVSDLCVRTIESYFLDTINDIDLYVYCPIEFEMFNDGVRTVDKKFQKDIDNAFQSTCKFIPQERVLFVSGETPDRLEQIKSRVREILK